VLCASLSHHHHPRCFFPRRGFTSRSLTPKKRSTQTQNSSSSSRGTTGIARAHTSSSSSSSSSHQVPCALHPLTHQNLGGAASLSL
jgi:hypothetical protein